MRNAPAARMLQAHACGLGADCSEDPTMGTAALGAAAAATSCAPGAFGPPLNALFINTPKSACAMPGMLPPNPRPSGLMPISSSSSSASCCFSWWRSGWAKPVVEGVPSYAVAAVPSRPGPRTDAFPRRGGIASPAAAGVVPIMSVSRSSSSSSSCANDGGSIRSFLRLPRVDSGSPPLISCWHISDMLMDVPICGDCPNDMPIMPGDMPNDAPSDMAAPTDPLGGHSGISDSPPEPRLPAVSICPPRFGRLPLSPAGASMSRMPMTPLIVETPPAILPATHASSVPNELLICACMRALDRRPGLFPTRGSGGFTVPPSSGTAAAALAAGKAAAAAISLPSLAAWRSLCTCARRVLGAPPLSLGIGKLQRAFGPRIARAASSYARAASSAESNVPSQRRCPTVGSRISAAHLPQGRCRTPR
mmetsp:Transcript_25803/g.76413  ORF Transcript_25803/g.76413 Transcript_25803/m.76413 type:complete len:421 (-) Transcript_25803:300-1562(-)